MLGTGLYRACRMRVRSRQTWLRPGLLLALGVLPALAVRASDGLVTFPAQRRPDGTAIPAHRFFAGDGSDQAAAARRLELLRAPYLGASRDAEVRGGEIALKMDASLPASVSAAVASALDRAAADLFDHAGFRTPYSENGRLYVLVSGGRDGVGAAGWAGRENRNGPLVDPVVSVTGGERTSEAVALDAVHGLAVLTLRRASPSAASWAVEGFAEAFARRSLGARGEPEGADPLRAEAGDAREPVVFAALADHLLDSLPNGAADFRAAWDDARGGGADTEALVRELGSRADPRGIPGLLADLVSARAAGAPSPPARRPGGDLTVASPGAFGWRRAALTTAGERGGLELFLADGAPGLARAVVFYGGENGGFDGATLEPGAPRRFPLAGTTELDLLLVDGDGSDVPLRARRLPDYPAALASASAEREDKSEGPAVRLSWRTSAHRDLLAWVVVREDEGEDGAYREASRELVPTSAAATTDYDYVILDQGAGGRRSRYRVYALTTEGFLSETFEATVSAVE
jgi:hypothetical protein